MALSPTLQKYQVATTPTTSTGGAVTPVVSATTQAITTSTGGRVQSVAAIQQQPKSGLARYRRVQVVRAQQPQQVVRAQQPQQVVRRTVVIKRPTQQQRPGVYTEYVSAARQAQQAVQRAPAFSAGLPVKQPAPILAEWIPNVTPPRAPRLATAPVQQAPAFSAGLPVKQPAQTSSKAITRYYGLGIGAVSSGLLANETAAAEPATQQGLLETAGAWWEGANRYVSNLITSGLPIKSPVLYGKIAETFAAGASKSFVLPEEAAVTGISEVTGVKYTKPSEAIGSYVGGEVEGAISEPLTTGVSFAAGAALGGGTRGISALVSRSGRLSRYAGTTVSLLGRTTTKGAIISKGITYGLGGMYGADVAYRSTNELTTIDPAMISRNLGYITSTEAAPLIAGGYAGFYAPEIARGGYTVLRSGLSRAYGFGASRLSTGTVELTNLETGRVAGYAKISATKPSARATAQRLPTAQDVYYGTVPKERSLIAITPEYSTASDVSPGKIGDILGIKIPRDVVPVYERSYATGELAFRGIRPSEGAFADIINVYERIPGTYAFESSGDSVMRQGTAFLPDIETGATLRQNQPFVAVYRATSDWLTGAAIIEESPAFMVPASEFNYLEAFGKAPAKGFELPEVVKPTTPKPRSTKRMKPFERIDTIDPTGFRTLSEQAPSSGTGQVLKIKPSVTENEVFEYYGIPTKQVSRPATRVISVATPQPTVSPVFEAGTVLADVVPRTAGSRYSWTGKLIPTAITIPSVSQPQAVAEYVLSETNNGVAGTDIFAATFGTGTGIGGGNIVVPEYDEKLIVVPRTKYQQIAVQDYLSQYYMEPQYVARNIFLTKNIFIPYTGFPGSGLAGGGGGFPGWTGRGAMDELWRLGDLSADPFLMGEFIINGSKKRNQTTTRRKRRK